MRGYCLNEAEVVTSTVWAQRHIYDGELLETMHDSTGLTVSSMVIIHQHRESLRRPTSHGANLCCTYPLCTCDSIVQICMKRRAMAV